MKKIQIITDSSITIDEKIKKELNIEVVPLNVMIDDTIYSDDELTGESFMEKMAKSLSLPKTSQPSVGLFSEIYTKYPEKTHEVLSIHMTKFLSGTVDSARSAVQLGHDNVVVIDSGFTDQALAFQVIEAAKMAQNGCTKKEILEKIEKIRVNTKLFIGISTLENLVKGGRIGKAKGLLSNILNIKVIMQLYPEVEKGLQLVAKGRGNKAFTKWFNELKETLSKTPNIKRIAISHADGEGLALSFKKELEAMFPKLEVAVMYTGSVIATHTGAGAFAIEYYTD